MSKDPSAKLLRDELKSLKRIVVKVGTRVLANPTGKPDAQRMRQLVEGITELHRAGKEVVLVSSGAIGLGVDTLNLKRRPTLLPDLQLAAAVGQTRLMNLYEKYFSVRGITVGQVLLTHSDLDNRTRHLNARNAMLNMLRRRVLPIVNENDVVAVDEIKLGDNDVLAALTTLLVDADLLVLLTSVNGLREQGNNQRSRRIDYLPKVNKDFLALARGKTDNLSTGGMATKLQAAQIAVSSGALAVIADGRKENVLPRIIAGKDLGTLIGEKEKIGSLTASRKRWIAFFRKAQGTVVIDDGAAKALEKLGKSLLAIGIKSVRGDFEAGSLVNIESVGGKLLGRGLVSYSSDEIEKIVGLPSQRIASVLGKKNFDEVIHRDNLVVFETND